MTRPPSMEQLDREKLRQWDLMSTVPAVMLGATRVYSRTSERQVILTPAESNTRPPSLSCRSDETPTSSPVSGCGSAIGQGPVHREYQEINKMINETMGSKNIYSSNRNIRNSQWNLTVSAGELLGQTHEELVLLLIQLRRQRVSICKAMEMCHNDIETQTRLTELDTPTKIENLQRLDELKKHLLELEKQYEKVSKMVKFLPQTHMPIHPCTRAYHSLSLSRSAAAAAVVVVVDPPPPKFRQKFAIDDDRNIFTSGLSKRGRGIIRERSSHEIYIYIGTPPNNIYTITTPHPHTSHLQLQQQSHTVICPPTILYAYSYLGRPDLPIYNPLHRMTPTIQCFDDQSMQIPPASVLCNNMFFQENHHQLTSTSDKTNSRPDVRTNHQWTPYLRNRHSTFSSKRNISYASALKPEDVKRLLRRDNESPSVATAAVTEEHLNAIRKRQALLLVTIQTMTLFHHNQILEHKLSALHRKVVQVQNRQRQRNIRSAVAEE